MPEYLAPGVFIEEVPPRLRAIEGVSTSTAGFVGAAGRGPRPGFDPFTRPFAGGFEVTLDPTPVFVSSFAQFTRVFGPPPESPDDRGFLAYAVQGFFANGGKRCFVARVTSATTAAAAASTTIDHGIRLRLTARPRAGDTHLYLNSLRGLATGATNDLEFREISDDSVVSQWDVAAVEPLEARVAVTVALTEAQAAALDPARVYAVPAAAALTANAGPRFTARSEGAWGNRLYVRVAAGDRSPARVQVNATNSQTVQIDSTGAFYRGAIVEVRPAGGAASVVTVDELLPGNQLRLSGTVSVAPDDTLQVLEIEVELQDQETGAVETFRGLTWNDDALPEVRARHYATVINAQSRLAWVQPPWAGLGGTEGAALGDVPATANGDLVAFADQAGGDGALPGANDVIGVDAGPGNRTGLQSLQDEDEISIVAAPGYVDAAVHGALITQAELLRYRFAVLDGERDPAGGAITSIIAHRTGLETSYAAYYTPWLELLVGTRRLVLPPAGHVAGVYARTDVDRGVWKAPANVVVRAITGLHVEITTPEQELLNPRGINVIRRFARGGIRVWGARTLSSDASVKYVNVRRYLIFLEASLDRGTQWVVFEPNDPPTWERVVSSVSAFLFTQWRDGALVGRRPEDAYFVICDETTMSQDDIQNGRLICEIGVCISRPAEFVIFRIEQVCNRP
jgi:phage tail sheath protein FI